MAIRSSSDGRNIASSSQTAKIHIAERDHYLTPRLHLFRCNLFKADVEAHRHQTPLPNKLRYLDISSTAPWVGDKAITNSTSKWNSKHRPIYLQIILRRWSGASTSVSWGITCALIYVLCLSIFKCKYSPDGWEVALSIVAWSGGSWWSSTCSQLRSSPQVGEAQNTLPCCFL